MWRNLNLVLAWVAIGYLAGSAVLMVPLWAVFGLVDRLFPQSGNLTGSPFVFLAAAIVSAWIWRRRGLLPRTVQLGRESRLRRGERLIATTTVLFLVGGVGPFLLYRLLHSDVLINFMFLGGLVGAFCVPLWVVGLIAVYSSAVRSASGGAPEAGR